MCEIVSLSAINFTPIYPNAIIAADMSCRCCSDVKCCRLSHTAVTCLQDSQNRRTAHCQIVRAEILCCRYAAELHNLNSLPQTMLKEFIKVMQRFGTR